MATAEKSEKLDGATFRTHRVLRYQPQAVYEAFARPDLLAHRRAGENEQNLDRLVSVLSGEQRLQGISKPGGPGIVRV